MLLFLPLEKKVATGLNDKTELHLWRNENEGERGYSRTYPRKSFKIPIKLNTNFYLFILGDLYTRLPVAMFAYYPRHPCLNSSNIANIVISLST